MDQKQNQPSQTPPSSTPSVPTPVDQPVSAPASPSQPAENQPTSQTSESVDALFPSSPNDGTSDPLTEEVEKDLVDHIITNLEESKLTVEQAQSLAKEFLALLPFQDKHDLVQKLNSLSEKYDEAKAVYVKYAGPVEEEERQRKISEMASHIKAGNIEQALAVAKGETTS